MTKNTSFILMKFKLGWKALAWGQKLANANSGMVGEQLWKRHVDQMHQKHVSNQGRKPEIIVTLSSDTVDVKPVTPPQTETAEIPRWKQMKLKVAKMTLMRIHT